MTMKEAEMKHVGYAILNDMGDLFLSWLAVGETADMPMEYPGMKVQKLHKLVIFTAPSQGTLKGEKNSTLCNHICHYDVDKQDCCVFLDGIGEHISTKELLMDYPVKEGTRAYSKLCAAMETWPG